MRNLLQARRIVWVPPKARDTSDNSEFVAAVAVQGQAWDVTTVRPNVEVAREARL
jgi:hypothetical protein